MPLIPDGTQLVCTKSHVFGTPAQNIPDGQTIAAQGLDFGADVAMHINPRNDGHRCRSCGERVTHHQDGAYQIGTAGGWGAGGSDAHAEHMKNALEFVFASCPGVRALRRRAGARSVRGGALPPT